MSFGYSDEYRACRGCGQLVGPHEFHHCRPIPSSSQARRERVVRAAVLWLEHADAACEQDDELIELAKATRALIEAGDAP